MISSSRPPVGLGDEADSQRMRRQPLVAVTLEARHASPLRQDLAHRIRMQGGPADLPPLLMRRNGGPALRLATACQAGYACEGQVSVCAAPASALSRSYCRVQALQFDACIGRGELPVCLDVVLVAVLPQSGDFA